MWALLLVLACGPKVADGAKRTEASAGIRSAEFAALLEAHWEAQMRASPEWATMLGDYRFNREVSDRSVGSAEARADAAARWRAEAGSLTVQDDRDAMFLRLFREQLDSEIAGRACQSETWMLSARINPMSDLFSVLDVAPIRGPDDIADAVARVDAWIASLAGHRAALAAGVSAGRVASAASLERLIQMVERQVAAPAVDWPPLQRELPEGALGEAWRTALVGAIDARLREALRAYADHLRTQVMPHGQPDVAPGIAAMPDAGACYEALILRHTTLPRSPEALHQAGLDALARVHGEMLGVSERLWGVTDRAALFERLRSDPSLRFATADEVLAAAETALRKAEAAVPRAFGRLPRTPCEVAVIPAYEAPYTTIAYYRQPNPDGSKPGEYFVNTYEPSSRPRHEAEALAFHESVPGHHLQIALSYELPATPAFHRYDGATAFVEGWGLYAERLADDLGLYSDDVSRLGMMSFDTWRAARLVVDTGLHAKGWSREQAVAFMLENTPLAENNIRNEVDRYITWPGQALAYKTGQMELLALRAEAEAALGGDFDRARFHDTVLGAGAVSLPVLRERVERWVERGGR